MSRQKLRPAAAPAKAARATAASGGAAAAGGARASSRREELLEALEEVFLREGGRRLSVGELAARLRCSRQTLYELAPSKDDLFLRVLDRLLERIRSRGREAAASRTAFRDRIVAYLEPGIRELRSASGRFFADVAALPRARRMLADHQRERRAEIAALIEEGIRAGAFRGVHTDLIADVIVAAVQRAMDPDLLLETGVPPSHAIAEVEDLILQGLLYPTGRAGRSRRGGTRGASGPARSTARPGAPSRQPARRPSRRR